jgi:hypothetical protein
MLQKLKASIDVDINDENNDEFWIFLSIGIIISLWLLSMVIFGFYWRLKKSNIIIIAANDFRSIERQFIRVSEWQA